MDLQALGNHGGFSGARLWRVTTFCGTFCLKLWPLPTTKVTFWSLRRIHQLTHLASCFDFVPRILSPRSLGTYVLDQRSERCWDLSTWLPGRADFHHYPTLARLQAALTGMARLHQVWATEAEVVPAERCPAVTRRVMRLAEADQVDRRIEERLPLAAGSILRSWAQRAWEQFRRWLVPAQKALQTWTDRHVPLQFCLCDIWHDHVLFEGNQLTGIVDYGSVRFDNVAADLARLLGSLVGDDAAMRAAALEAYEAHRPLRADERELVSVLDWTGVVVGASNWLRWLYVDNRHFEDEAGVVKRLSALVTRMEEWKRPPCGTLEMPSRM